MMQSLGHYDEMSKKGLEAFEMWIWRRMACIKWTDKIENVVVLKIVGGGRRITCIRFADYMALLAEDERMLKKMLMELNDRCEDYEMKTNINKTDMRIKDESVEQLDSFKYLGCNISSNMNCYQE